MTQGQLSFILLCIAEDRVHDFYIWPEWTKTRGTVLDFDRHECQRCKARGYYARATLVHHVRHLRDFPQYALDLFITDKESGDDVRQLISLCKRCHELEHPEIFRTRKNKKYLTEERW